jgi:CheY-like chemotaxis protein
VPRRVLYVEDDRVAVLLFVEALRGAPEFEVEVAESGAEALQLAARWHPDVLVLDAHLPDTTGLTLLTHLRTLPGLQRVPAFICSADALMADDLGPSSGDIAGCWLKPVQRAQMLADLVAALRPSTE